jgi:hypothetical protein
MSERRDFFSSPATASGPETVSVAVYLSARLQQLGVEHLFGVPGTST